jgi:hypothetical protein
MDRRTLLKIMGGMAALPALGKAIKGTGIKAIKTAGKVLPKVSGMPEWFSPLVNKIMKEGVDVSPAAKRVEDMTTVKKLEIPSATGEPEVITLTQNKTTGEISIEANFSGGTADAPFELNYRPPKSDINLETGKEVKYPGEFSVVEQRPKPLSEPGDFEFDYESLNVGDAFSDIEKLEKIGTGKIKDVKKIEERAKGRKMLEQSPYEDIINRYPDPDIGDYDYADGGIASFANGGKAKKKFLENENKDQDLSPEELEEKYQQEINDLLTRPAPPGLNFTTEEGGQGAINLMFGPKIKKDNYSGFGPRIESNINPRVDIRDPRIGISYTSNPEDQTASKFGINIGPKGAYVGYTRNFANGGVAGLQITSMRPTQQESAAGLVFNPGPYEGPYEGPYILGGPRPGQYYQSSPITSITGPDGAIPRPGMPMMSLPSTQTSQTDVSTNPIAKALEMAGFTREEIMRIISERGYADGGLTKTVPPVKGPDSQGVETLFKRRYN